MYVLEVYMYDWRNIQYIIESSNKLEFANND